MDLKKLYRRSLTGLVFGLVVLFLILFNDWTARLFVWLVAMLCALENLQIRKATAWPAGLIWLLALITGPALAVMNALGLFIFSPLLPLIIISVLYHLYLGGRIIFNYPYSQNVFNVVFSTFLYIGFPLLLLNQTMMDRDGSRLLLNMLLLIWTSDTFAYLAGSLIGKNKLLPRVSPGKTVEGALGGLVFSLIAGYLLYIYANMGSLVLHLGLALVIWFFGLVGDLVESHLKRQHALKDSGHLLPGHGGFLDRFDAFIYMVPFVLLYLLLWEF